LSSFERRGVFFTRDASGPLRITEGLLLKDATDRIDWVLTTVLPDE
jgi:hypothetical protein